MKTRLAGLLLCSLTLGGPAAAAVITLNLDDQVSGLSPAGAAQWVTATFTESAGGVDLSIAATGLSAGEYINRFFFNFNPTLNAASYLPSTPGTGTQTDWNSIGAGSNQWAFGTAGPFDFYIDFPPPGTDLFTSGETFHVRFSTVSSAADFNFASSGGYLAAAEIAGIGTAGATGLGGIGAAAVPEPGALALLGLGLAGLAASRRRKQ